MKVSGNWLTRSETQAVCAALANEGWKALPVGGCVRNALLGFPVTDVDIATDARPEIVTDLAEKAGFQVVPTGIDHGTVTVLAKGIPHEVTTFRQDVDTNGRHAVVAFSNHLEHDAARRDFTMNALYCQPDGPGIDPLGGMEDLRARRVRFVGAPEARIREDYLRILRFFRFNAWYGDPEAGLDAEGLAACALHSDGLETLSRERVGAEMKKLLAAADPAPAVAAMAKAGVLLRVLPGADARGLAPLIHLEQGRTPDWLRRLAVLGGDRVADGLRLSRAEARDLDALRLAVGSTDTPAALGWRLGESRGFDAVFVRAATMEQPVPPTALQEVARGAATPFPVRAGDLPGLTGRALGARLKELESRWLHSDLRLGKSQLLD